MKMPQTIPRGRAVVATLGLIACTLLLYSCVDLGKVNEFAKASQDVGKAFKSIAQEGQTSCGRTKSFLLPGQEPPDCEFYTRVEPSLLKINDALFAYVSGLGKLASADASKVADGLKDVTTELKRADPKISQSAQDQAKAATGLAQALAGILTSEYRRHALVKAIVEANGDGEKPGPLKQVTSFLSDYAAEKYTQDLNTEQILEANYCQDRTERFRQSEPLAFDLFQHKCAADLAQILEKKNAIVKYREALSAVAAGHQKLYDSRNSWSTKELAFSLTPEITQLVDAASSMKKAF